MLSKELIRKLDTYFGFAQKKHSLFAGMELEDKLERRKVSLLIFLPSCSAKDEDKLLCKYGDNPDLAILDYDGEYNVALASGRELLKAVGVGDLNLAKAIYNILKDDKKVSEDTKENKEETK
jgi:ERCC4-type nuclease